MEYIRPTVERFKTRYPEFGIVSDEIVDEVLSDSISAVGPNWLDKDRARGQLLLTAHNLSCEGEPRRSQAINNGMPVNSSGGSTGQVTEFRDRDAFVRFSDTGANLRQNNNRGESAKAYQRTHYGEQYYKLLRKNTCFVTTT